ncbi:response regulator [Virgibacillus sp. W0181]|uniref:response regulator n=1 Tax=Virgibacillus sp. W0181 TaxID=3391581 RepID=UPI003F48A1B6
MKSKLLIVDDQPGIRLLLTDIFESEGYLVEAAKTGKEAVQKVENNVFDLIMLDYKLPIIDGYQFIKQMEADYMQVPVIVMSGLVENIDIEIKESYLVKKIVAKPFNVQDICDTVSTILNSGTDVS